MKGFIRHMHPGVGKSISVSVLMLAILTLQIFLASPEASASHTNIKFPFAAGTSWSVLQGYNTDPSQGGTHYNCDPNTLKDTVSQSVSCTAPWQYRYSIDVYETSGHTAGLQVLAPVSGTVRWTQASTGGITINMGDGYAIALFHVIVDPGIAAGTALQQGQVIGTVAPPNVAGAGNNPHIHITLWETTDGGNWSRTARPFTGDTTIDGVSLPDLGAGTFNQHRGKAVYSTNQPLSSGTAPSPPSLVAPASGATITAASTRVAFTWNSVPDATGYQLMINDSIQSPWVGVPNWTSDALPNGTYTWKVRAAKNQSIGVWSGSRSFTVNSSGAPAAPSSLSTSLSKGKAGEIITVSGTGFKPGEPVDLRWDSATAAPLSTITANGSGTFSSQLTVPDSTRGNHTLLAKGRTSGSIASRNYEVVPSLGRTPVEGAPGTSVVVTAKGYGAGEQVRLNWGSATGPVVGTVTTGATGTGSVTITIPNGRPGWTDYVGTGQTSGGVSYGAINVLSKVFIYPSSAAAGTTVHADAGAYPPNTAFTVTFGPSSGTSVCSGSVAADGIVRCQFQVPQVGAGGYPVTISAGSVSLTQTLIVTGPPAVGVTPAQRAVGVNITVTAGGFTPGEYVSFRWDNGTWQSAKADTYGSATLLATVPETSKGNHQVTALGDSSGRSATMVYAVGDGQNIGGSGMISPGVYSVFATREGLVGGTTSSGHVIVPNDYFVSLPGCTPTNCSGGFTPGNMTQCGTKCFVKVINPITNVCRVEPIYDVGPWFTVDDWWNPTNTRYLNNLASNPNTLAQGYPGSEAARNKLDVGYGRGPNGYGRDNTGTIPGRQYREVGNAAAIDLADGTWYALAPQGNSVGAMITVEMLWQTGADPASSANACGHPLNQRPGDNVSYPPGTANPSFTGKALPITNTFDTPATGTAGRVVDGNSSSNWATAQNTPTYATLTLDLGTDQDVSGVKWMFAYTGFADSFNVSVTSASGQKTSLGRFGNAPQGGQWYGIAPGRPITARFVTFTFSNPNRDKALGSVAEVQVWGKSVIPPGTANPTFSGVKLPITNSYDSPATSTSRRAHDGLSYTNWAIHNPSGYSKVTFDLGFDQDLSGIRWKFAYLGYADQFTVRVYNSQGGWRDLGVFGNATSTQTWYGVATSAPVKVRFVELIFPNPNGDSAVGSISEIEMWGTRVYSPGTPNTNFPGTKLAITNSSDSPASGTSNRARDGATYTNWASPQSTPFNANIKFDLGRDQDLTGIRWKFAYLGYADQYIVRVYNSNGQWRDLGVFGNAGASQTFSGYRVNDSVVVRFVEFIFLNPNRDVAVGSLSEVEIWGNGMFAAAADPSPPGAPLALTCSADPASSDGNRGAERACDLNGGTNWHTDANSPESVTLTVKTEPGSTITGVKWNFAQQGNSEQFEVRIGTGDQLVSQGRFSGGGANMYEGVIIDQPIVGDTVTLTFTNIDSDAELGYLAEVEVWGIAAPPATPQASQVSSPQASPQASPSAKASPELIPDETPATPSPQGTPAPDVSASPTVEETPAPAASPEAIETPAPAASPEAIETIAPTPTTASAEDVPATPDLPPTPEPTVAMSIGTITNTDGDLINCRRAPVDGDPIVQLAEGDQIDVTGTAQDGWYPVVCNGEAGFISADFVTLGIVAPEDITPPTPTEVSNEDASPETVVTETPLATMESTAEPTEEPIESPYPIVDTGDTEDSGTAWLASDNDASTWWSVYPDQNPEQTRLYVDLGSVLPIDRVTMELATWDQLPTFEIWLSETGDVWYNATPGGINGWNLERDVPVTISLGYDARYLRLVIPNVDESGLGEIGGVRQIDVWPGNINDTLYVSSLGAPTTPTPPPVVEEPPTEEVVQTPVEEVIDEEVPTEEQTMEPPVEEPIEPTLEPTAPPEDTPDATEEAVG